MQIPLQNGYPATATPSAGGGIAGGGQGGPQSQADQARRDQVRKVAQDFEAQFLSEMLSHVFAGIEPDKMFGGGKGEAMFQSLLVNEYGKKIASTGTTGIADAVQRVLLQTQER